MAFSPCRCHRPPPPAAAACSQRQRLPQHAAAACRRSAPQGVARLSAVWTGGVGWVTVERQGFTGVEGLGTTGLKTLRGAPRSWTERAYPKLIYYNRVDKGGHFAAWEQPQLFSDEIRAAFRSLRSSWPAALIHNWL
jgi:pimeloyl-ACP methyl ester carboxylesterase